MIKKVIGLYFSSMEGSIEIIESVAEDITKKLNEDCACKVACEFYDFGAILSNENLKFDKETVVVLGVPVIGAKIPLPCLNLLQLLEGNSAMTVAIVTYEGASYGRALRDLYNFAEHQGFRVISAGAFVVKNPRLAAAKRFVINRPDAKDFEMMEIFAKISGRKIRRLGGCEVELLQVKPAPLAIKVAHVNAAVSLLGMVKRQDPEWFL